MQLEDGSDEEDDGPKAGGADGIEPGEKRLTAIGEDCPMYVPARHEEELTRSCFEEMTQADNDADKLVFDVGIAGCGKRESLRMTGLTPAIHKECFTMWAATAVSSRILCAELTSRNRSAKP